MLTLPSATKVAIREVTKPSAEVTLPKIRVPKKYNRCIQKMGGITEHKGVWKKESDNETSIHAGRVASV